MSLDVDALLSELTLEEKASLTSGSSFWYTAPIERLGIPKIMVSDGPHGLRAQPGEGDHVGLGGSLPATCFPTASAIASSWNPDLLRRVGEALAQEARAANLSVILGPGINMKRSPLCGRNFEYFSEDPYLAGELGVGIVEGIQSRGVGTSVKHYAANNQETDRLRVDAQVDERTLREIYLPAFERIVTTCQPWTIMCSYNKVNGLSASENPWLLTTVLREEFGFTGLVVSDWGAVYHRVPAARAGLDLEMPPNLPRSPNQVVAAVRAGELDEQVLDARARAVLELVDKGMGVLDLDEEFDAERNHALARAAAAESVVLLKNDDRILPLASGSRIAVIGEFARTPRFQGAGSSQVNPTKVENALDELRAAFGEVTFAAGYGIGDTSADEALRAEAVDVAAAAEAVVDADRPARRRRVGGLRSHAHEAARQPDRRPARGQGREPEGRGRAGQRLDGRAGRGPPARPRAGRGVAGWAGRRRGDRRRPVREGQSFRPARRVGAAPAGGQLVVPELPRRLPRRPLRRGPVHRLPRLRRHSHRRRVPVRLRPVLHHVRDVRPGRRGVGIRRCGRPGRAGDGHGLQHRAGGRRRGRAGLRPRRRGLCRPAGAGAEGFREGRPGAGESRQVTVDLDQRAFSFWSELLGKWVVEAGDFSIEVGRHSRDLPLTRTIAVDAPSIAPPLTADSTLHEWMADEQGLALIKEAVAAGQHDPTRDAELVSVIGTMPMSTLAAFEGMSIDHDTLDKLVERRHAH